MVQSCFNHTIREYLYICKSRNYIQQFIPMCTCEHISLLALCLHMFTMKYFANTVTMKEYKKETVNLGVNKDYSSSVGLWITVILANFYTKTCYSNIVYYDANRSCYCCYTTTFPVNWQCLVCLTSHELISVIRLHSWVM